ncbi:unnamed protein product [Durusdinium trenchii]|uniref:ATP-dependent DNA helicase n=2 Tax=Durusdinium trenchii TaxID=1381693 RepID=A0ABP0SFF5_9DINO
MQHADALERMECAPHPIHKDSLADALFRDREWYAVMANSKAKALKTSLQKLMQFVNCLGGVPDVKHGMGIRSNGTTELDRTWSHADTGRIFAAQKQYLEYIAGAETVDADMEDVFAENSFTELETLDPFLMSLNDRKLSPRDYALELVKEYTLNKQQVLAIAPVVCAIQDMFEHRSNPMSHIADGSSREKCNCLWLGAGGSGKTWAYTKVIRPLLQRFFGSKGYIVGAPTHAAVRLLGPEARTLHKWANVNPNQGMDRKDIRSAKSKGDAIESQILNAKAGIFDEMSMTPPDVYHASGYRFSILRQESQQLDLEKYLQEWFGALPIGIQLGDFLQLRPAMQKSLCEWVKPVNPTMDATLPDEDDESRDVSNASELGRLLFKNSLGKVVHFTGTGRFSDCTSGKQLVALLSSMRNGTEIPDALRDALQERKFEVGSHKTLDLKKQLLLAHWGGFAWEVVARLQQLRAALEAKKANKMLYLIQAIDRPTGGQALSKEQTLSALQVVNMTNTGYLIGMCPVFEGMQARITCILKEPMLTRELPVTIRQVQLHPREQGIAGDEGFQVLQYQPLAILVEIDDPEYRNYKVPGCDAPAGHFYLRAVTCEGSWSLQIGHKQYIKIVRKQFPLAPRNVLTHFGLQGVTARQGLVAFLSKPAWMSNSDYGLAMYVMLSRARKLEDLHLVDLPERHIFEKFLHEHNPLLVERMRTFEAQALQDETNALRYIKRLDWHQQEYVQNLFPRLAEEPTVRHRIRGKRTVPQ